MLPPQDFAHILRLGTKPGTDRQKIREGGSGFDVDSLVSTDIADKTVEETFIVGSDIEASNEKDVRPIGL
jgi:hypothetical protein